MAIRFKGFKKIFFSRPWPSLKQLGLMFVLLFIVVSLVAYTSKRNFEKLVIDGKVTEYIEVSAFHAMPEITIHSDTGKSWVLHNPVFKELDVKVGYSFIKRRGSTLGYINGNEVNLGVRR